MSGQLNASRSARRTELKNRDGAPHLSLSAMERMPDSLASLLFRAVASGLGATHTLGSTSTHTIVSFSVYRDHIAYVLEIAPSAGRMLPEPLSQFCDPISPLYYFDTLCTRILSCGDCHLKLSYRKEVSFSDFTG